VRLFVKYDLPTPNLPISKHTLDASAKKLENNHMGQDTYAKDMNKDDSGDICIEPSLWAALLAPSMAWIMKGPCAR